MQNRSEQKKAFKAVPLSHGDFSALFSLSPVPMAIADPETLKVMEVNRSFEDITGHARGKLLGQPLGSLVKGDGLAFAPATAEGPCQMNLCGRDVVGSSMLVEIGGRRCLLACMQDVTEQKKAVKSLEGIKTLLDSEVTQRKKAESISMAREKELQEVRRELGEMNTALKILIRQRIEDRAEVERSFLANVKTAVLPFLERLKESPLNETQQRLLAEIEEHMHEITSPFVREISSGHLGLSPNEIQVAALIKEGRSSKEISKLLNISIHTVISHRYCIRKKTGIIGRKINLRVYLQDLKG